MLRREIKIREKLIGSGHGVYIIAEMACAHDGDVNKARALIDVSAEAGVDAVQLQLFSVKDLMVPSHEVYDLLVKIEFSTEQWKELFDYARQYDMAVFACTYDMPSAALATECEADGIKLNSADLSNPEMVAFVAASGTPFTLGTGASTMEEIADAIEVSLSAGSDKLILMHGMQNFPTDIDNANIKRVGLLQEAFGAIVGYQDHTGAELPLSRVIDLLAVGAGALVIEKHITLDRKERGTDFQASLEPEEMKNFVELIRHSEPALGSATVRPLTESDMEYRKFQKKSIVAAEALVEGSVINRDKVLFMRSPVTGGLSPAELLKITGKRLSRSIERFDPVRLRDLTD